MIKKEKENVDERPFLKRHPLINALVAFLLLAAMCFAAYFILILLSKGLERFFSWLASVTSKLEAVVMVALITGILSILGGIVSKRIDYKKSRNEYLAQKREGPYGAFVNMIYKIMDNGKNPGSYSEADMKNDLLSFSQEITLWGSPRVAEKWVRFRENGTNPDKAFNNLYLIEDIMNEMRRDLGLRKIHKGGLLSFFVNDLRNQKRQ